MIADGQIWQSDVFEFEQAVLGLLEGTDASWLQKMTGCIINVNVPAGPLQSIKGLHLAHQVPPPPCTHACHLTRCKELG